MVLDNTSREHQTLQWLTMGAIGVAVALSVYGAFLGATRASAIFESMPLMAWGILLAALLIQRLFLLSGRLHRLGWLAMHLGGLLILAGGMWGAPLGHRIQANLLDRHKVPKGYMLIPQGQATNTVMNQQFGVEPQQLDFQLRLEKFWVDYYPTPEKADTETNKDTGNLRSHRQVRAFNSQVTVLEKGQEVVRGVIKVNKPLHYGGYHFYQYDYDRAQGRYTILSVVSDSGLNLVYLGFVLVGVGSVFHFWLRPVWQRIGEKRD